MLSDAETSEAPLARAGLDGVALKPTECSVAAAVALSTPTITIDYEGADHVPEAETLRSLAADHEVRVTTPVRADGYDPLGDDGALDELPDGVKRVLVAGHGAYLSESERARAVAPRLGAAVEAADDPWVGTEGIERVALATGATQFDLLSPTVRREARALRAAGFDGELAVYAPTVLTDEDDAVLDAVGEYAARRRPVAAALPDDAATDSGARGRAREVLLAAADDYALVGPPETVRERTDALREAGVDRVVGYPARGLAAWQ